MKCSVVDTGRTCNRTHPSSHYGSLVNHSDDPDNCPACEEAAKRRSPLYREPGHEIEPELLRFLRTIEDLLYSGILELAVQDADPKLENIRAFAAHIVDLIDRKKAEE
jgi:hypothetical protein